VRYGKQYDYRCPRCRREVVPPMTPSLAALDLTDIGTRIGDKPIKKFKDGFVGPLARTTMTRAERCRQRFADFPAVLMPAKAVHGTERHPWQPLATQTSQQETSILSAGAVFVAHRHNGDGKNFTLPMDTVTSTHEKAVLLAVDNYQGSPRGIHHPLPTQVGSQTLAVVSSGIIPFRQNTVPTVHAEAMPTCTADQIPGLLTATGTINTSETEAQLAAHWQATLADLPLEECYFRMMKAYEVGLGCGFDVARPGSPARPGNFIVWGSERNQVDGFGNAVSPRVGEWIGTRLRASIHAASAAA
jgi:site-specific DNA-cytosine methylase